MSAHTPGPVRCFACGRPAQTDLEREMLEALRLAMNTLEADDGPSPAECHVAAGRARAALAKADREHPAIDAVKQAEKEHPPERIR